MSSVDYLYYHRDLNGDGNSEEISYNMRYDDRLSVMVSSEGKVLDQWNFYGVWAKSRSPFFADYDNDGIEEIFFFTLYKDSIFLQCVDAFNKKVETKNKAVCKAPKVGNAYDFVLFPCGVFDADNDGFKEYYFSIQTGFPTTPRSLFAFNQKENKIRASPESCSPVIYPVMFDMDKDNRPEIMSTVTFALDNCEPDRKYNDLYSWLMIFTPDLKFRFPPVRFDIYPSTTWITPFNTGKRNCFLIVHTYAGSENYPGFLALFDAGGKLIRKKSFHVDESWYVSPLFSQDDHYRKIYILKSDSVLAVDSMLNMQYIIRLDNIAKSRIVRKMDIDRDGEKEFLFTGTEKGEAVVYRNDFSNPVTLKLDENAASYRWSVLEKKDESPKIFINADLYSYIFTYQKTFLYKLRFVLFIPIFLFIFFTHLLTQKIKNYRQLKFDHTQKQISELQVKSVQNQLDPHFTFNIFSSFANLINEKDTDRADYIFSKYAGLLKTNVMNSENIRITLQEELDFVSSYLELEKFRYQGKFSFTITMDTDIDKQMLIPKMLLHIFSENAVKHGLRHLDSGGKLLIHGHKHKGTVYIIITDNGIGRAKAKEYAGFSTGKGLKIMDQILDAYHRLYKTKITYSVSDLFEHNRASGTEIKIRIPVKLRYKAHTKA